MERSWAGRLIDAIARRAIVLVPLLLIAVAGVAVMARDLKIDNSLRIWFLEDDPALIAWDEFKDQFGNDEVIIIAATDPTSVYAPAALERVRAASNRMEQHDKVRRVTSITTGRHIDGDAIEIRTESLLPDGPVTEEEGRRVKERIEANPIFQGTITSKDDTMTLMLVELATLDDVDAERPHILRDLRTIAAEELEKDGGTAHFGGMGVVYEGLNEASLRDSQLFASLSYLVVFVGLFLMCRRIVWVLFGLAVVTIAVMGTIGIAGAMGRDLNMVTAVLPTLIMTVGILDLVHFIDAYDEGHYGKKPSRELLVRSLAVVVMPCAFNTLTDMIGFAALSSARMSAIRDMGWLAATGLAVLFVTIMVIVVPALKRFGGSRPRRQSREGWIMRTCHGVFRLVSERRRAVLAAGALLFAVALGGMSLLVVDTYTIGFLSGDDPVRRDHDRIQEQFGYFVPYEFVVETTVPGGIKDPDLLRRIEKVERAFETHPDVDRATGLPEIIARINQVVFDGEPEEYRIPDRREAVAQELLLYESDSRNELDQMVDGEFTVARVTARSGLPTARTIGKTLDELLALGQKELGPPCGDPDAPEVCATLKPAGYIPLYVRIIHHIARAQITSFAIAFVVITLVLMLLLRSVKLGLIALIPNVLPVAMTMGFMGYTGIRLDVATVLIAAIVIGISVNDTTHILFRFRHELAATPTNAPDALRRTLEGTGRAVIASSLILAAGFSVLLFAGVKSISYFGLLCSVATLFALLADLVITPAVLLTFKIAPGPAQPAPLGTLGEQRSAP